MLPARPNHPYGDPLPPATVVARERLRRRRQRRARRAIPWMDLLGWAAVLLFTGWLIFLQFGDPSIVLQGPLPEPGTIPMVVTGTRVNVREAPALGATVIGQVVQGDQVLVRDYWGGWYRIVSGGPSGWISGEYVDPVQTRSPLLSLPNL
ncbi:MULTISPECIES: SH3 domain-containing protein [Limnochorda]|uniref:SH3 domain-containing protein n=1 Tax=Limnochorda TaxID=1676651 RepID=UPI001852FEA3|nr:SH3 domain-containing protein [Limnochorda pilosa]MBO2485736.1 hypothetical protein [Bacillota bacterium]MBO2518260.1 hypothetical protein [Bacillota bacterium]NMA72199.1 SH3 domain-containing protein [Bacillota bacterium]